MCAHLQLTIDIGWIRLIALLLLIAANLSLFLPRLQLVETGLVYRFG